jgi:hypothetical protein
MGHLADKVEHARMHLAELSSFVNNKNASADLNWKLIFGIYE